MYRCVLSLSEEDALRLGYDDRQEWENMIQSKINHIGDKLNIPSSRLEYACAVHMEKGHPHMHFVLWDKEQGVKQPFVHPNVSNDIRLDLTKHIFQDELSSLYQLKNEIRDNLVWKEKELLDYCFNGITKNPQSSRQLY